MITQTITNNYAFWDWLRNSDSYKNTFTMEAAKAIQEYYNQLSEDAGTSVEFDPIAWCCEFDEYESLEEAAAEYNQFNEADQATKEEILDWFRDHTTVIKLDNGHIILGGF